MKRFIILAICISGLVACSSKSYVETSDGLTERKIDRSQAAQSRLTLALKYIELKSYQEAKVNLDKAMNYDAENAAVYLGYAYYYQRVNESKQAESAYLKARELAPKDGNIRNNYGTFLCAQQKYAAAEQEFMAAISAPFYNKVANSYDNAGQCALKQGDDEKALAYFKSAYAHAPQNVTPLLSMAELNYKLARYQRANQLFLQYEAVTTANASSLWLGFKIANKLGKSAVAEQYSRNLLKQFPLSTQTKQYIANDY